MAQTASAAGSADGGGVVTSLKEKGNEFFKAGNYLKAAALYTQAIKQDPNNAALYRLWKWIMNMLGENDRTSAIYELKQGFKSSNRAAAFLHLVKLSKALADAETTITLNPQWEKGYFRKGCIFEAMERYEESFSAFEAALQHNPQSSEVVKKVKRLSQLVKDKRRAEEIEELRSNVQMEKHLDTFKTELCTRYGLQEESKEVLSFVTETMERAVKSWHETSKVDPRVYFFLDLQRTETEKYASVVNIDKAFESPQTHSECFTFLRKYAEDSFSKATCLVSPKSIISYPQVWKGQGSRKWKHGLHDGFFIQFESPFLRKLWFIPSSTEKGKTLCRDPVALDISAHELLPRVFKEKH